MTHSLLTTPTTAFTRMDDTLLTSKRDGRTAAAKRAVRSGVGLALGRSGFLVGGMLGVAWLSSLLGQVGIVDCWPVFDRRYPWHPPCVSRRVSFWCFTIPDTHVFSVSWDRMGLDLRIAGSPYKAYRRTADASHQQGSRERGGGKRHQSFTYRSQRRALVSWFQT